MKITSGKIKKPHLGIVFGVEGSGKSTLGSTYPAPIFVGPENGSHNLDISRVEELKTYKDIMDSLEYLNKEKHDFKTVVIDSLDWVEPLLYKFLCEKYKTDAIEDVGGGYGRYVAIMLGEWSNFITALEKLRERGMNVLLIAHYHVKTFNDPSTNEPYERYLMKLQEKTSAKFREWVDYVFFLNFETFTKKEKGSNKAKAFSDGERYLFTQKTAAYDAKNRFGLPEKMKLETFKEIDLAINGASASEVELIKQEIKDLMLDLKDKELLPKIELSIENSKNDFSKLTAIKNRLKEIV